MTSKEIECDDIIPLGNLSGSKLISWEQYQAFSKDSMYIIGYVKYHLGASQIKYSVTFIIDFIDHLKKYNSIDLLEKLFEWKLWNKLDHTIKDKIISRGLSYACKKGYEKIINILLANLSLGYKDGDQRYPNRIFSPLVNAVIHGHIKIVTLLINDKRFDCYYTYNYALNISVRKGFDDIAKNLLESKIPSYDLDLIVNASSEGHSKVVELLLKRKDAIPQYKDNKAIRYASENGHSKVVELLLKDQRVDPSARENYAIRLACFNGHIEVVRLLLVDVRVNPSSNNNQAIKNAKRGGYDNVVVLLLTDKRVVSKLKRKDNEWINKNLK